MVNPMKTTQAYLRRRRQAKTDRKIEKIFRKTDTDQSGMLSVEELKSYLGRILKQVPSDEEMEDFMSLYDLDGNRELDFGEFKSMMTRYDGMAALGKGMDSREARVFEAFLEFDRDGDGYITRDEILSTLKGLYGREIEEEEAERMMEEADANGDGKVDYREFKMIVGKI